MAVELHALPVGQCFIVSSIYHIIVHIDVIAVHGLSVPRLRGDAVHPMMAITKRHKYRWVDIVLNMKSSITSSTFYTLYKGPRVHVAGIIVTAFFTESENHILF